MTKFGKALKSINIDKLMADIQKQLKRKPKRYRPKMTEKEHLRRQKKARYEWYKRERNTHGYTVYYDRKRKGWFYRDEFGNRYGYRNSKDLGYDSRDKAINAIQRKYRKKLKEQREYLNQQTQQQQRVNTQEFFPSLKVLNWKPTGEALYLEFYRDYTDNLSQTAIYMAFELDKRRANAIFNLVGHTKEWFYSEDHKDGLAIQAFIEHLGLHIVYDNDGKSTGAMTDAEWTIYHHLYGEEENEEEE